MCYNWHTWGKKLKLGNTIARHMQLDMAVKGHLKIQLHRLNNLLVLLHPQQYSYCQSSGSEVQEAIRSTPLYLTGLASRAVTIMSLKPGKPFVSLFGLRVLLMTIVCLALVLKKIAQDCRTNTEILQVQYAIVQQLMLFMDSS